MTQGEEIDYHTNDSTLNRPNKTVIFKFLNMPPDIYRSLYRIYLELLFSDINKYLITISMMMM